MSLHKEKDLTRWNRAGLSRLRYVDGNAITYLETLREAAAEAFTESGVNSWQALETRHPVIANENPAERQARWLAQYYDERRDHGWEILRALSRASHVLGETIDTYANENLLRTCTEWDNLRRLVEMLDYHPSPPASAETWLAILAKEDTIGTLEAGFAVKNKPADGSKASIFETLSDIDISDELNLLYPVDWDRSQLPFGIDPATDFAEFPLEEIPEDVSAGNLGVLLIEQLGGDPLGLAVEVSDIAGDSLLLAVEPSAVPITGIKRSEVRLFLRPAYRQGTLLTGDRVMELEPDHGLGQGQIVAWRQSGWKVGKIVQVLDNRVRLSRNAPPAGTEIYATAYSDTEKYEIDGGTENRVVVPAHNNDSRFDSAAWDHDFNYVDYYSSSYHQHATDSGAYLYDYWNGSVYSRIFYVPSADPVTSVVESAPADLSIAGKPGKFSTSDWLLLESEAEEVFAVQVEAVSEGDGSYSLLVTPPVADARLVRGVFGQELRPRDHNRNYEPVFLTHPDFRSEYASVLSLDLPAGAIDYPELLEPGRRLCVDAGEEAMLVTVKAVDSVNHRIKVAPALPGSEPSASGGTPYTAFDTRIYGNVVAAGHGESQAWKVLGSGDATSTNQAFVLDVDDVSFTVNAQFPPGVSAALVVSVDGRTWTQVASLNDSASEDHHYSVRVREDNSLLIQFGDGTRGRRLPSGNNNVRVSYRRGVGLAGNVDPFALEKAVKPHYLVDDQLQPLPATGGADRESAASLRENAPESVLTLERAVSLSDYKHLAASNSSVWQAQARLLPAGLARRQNIEVAVVPAGGGPLGNLEDSLKSYLQANATPGVAVSIRGYRALILDLELVITVDESAFDPEMIAQAVCDSVLDDFSLERAKLGASFYRSQVFAVVEAITGVENCQCVINPSGFIDENGSAAAPAQLATSPGGAIKRITPFWEQLVYASADLSTLNISTQGLES